MTDYTKLRLRLENREVIILDGAIGTQLQNMGVPMDNDAWCALALETHPYTVRRMHENYIRAGVDVITVNTYAAARHNLVPVGLSDRVKELNLRAVMLAQEARDACAKDRPIYIAGSVSNYGLLAGAEPGWANSKYVEQSRRIEISDTQAKANLQEQAEVLAEAGVDLILAEPTGSTTQRGWVIEACVATGLPVWAGFKCRLDAPGSKVSVGYLSNEDFEVSIDKLITLGAEVVTIFHSTVESTSAALPIMQRHWQGSIGLYPEADRSDYTNTYKDNDVATTITPNEFEDVARTWIEQGVQIIGGCCGIEIEFIRSLREALPKRLPAN
jgi:S-methylmethionine-dependent homocysteine/selenocysteine methylase